MRPDLIYKGWERASRREISQSSNPSHRNQAPRLHLGEIVNSIIIISRQAARRVSSIEGLKLGKSSSLCHLFVCTPFEATSMSLSLNLSPQREGIAEIVPRHRAVFVLVISVGGSPRVIGCAAGSTDRGNYRCKRCLAQSRSVVFVISAAAPE